MRLVCLKLKSHPASKISFPNDEQKQNYAAMIHFREPLVQNIIGFVDGLRLSCRCGDSDVTQSIDYSGQFFYILTSSFHFIYFN
jgi:hypothetical protein